MASLVKKLAMATFSLLAMLVLLVGGLWWWAGCGGGRAVVVGGHRRIAGHSATLGRQLRAPLTKSLTLQNPTGFLRAGCCT